MVLTAPQQWIRCHRCLFGPVPCGRVAKAPIAVCLRSGCEGVWPFRIRCQRASFLSLCRLPHVFCPPMCSPTAVCGPVYLSVLKHRVDRLQTYFFLPCLSSDCAGVWPFRIRCQRANFCLCASQVAPRFLPTYVLTKRLPLCVCAYVLGLLSFPLGVPKVALRPLGNDA